MLVLPVQKWGHISPLNLVWSTSIHNFGVLLCQTFGLGPSKPKKSKGNVEDLDTKATHTAQNLCCLPSWQAASQQRGLGPHDHFVKASTLAHHPYLSSPAACRPVLENLPLSPPQKEPGIYYCFFLLRILGCFYRVKTSCGSRRRMGCLTTLNARSWQGGEEVGS